MTKKRRRKQRAVEGVRLAELRKRRVKAEELMVVGEKSCIASDRLEIHLANDGCFAVIRRNGHLPDASRRHKTALSLWPASLLEAFCSEAFGRRC